MIHVDRRAEDVLLYLAAEDIDRLARLLGRETDHIDDAVGVDLAGDSLERITVVAVAGDELDAVGNVGVGFAASETDDLVAVVDQLAGDAGADDTGAADK